MSKDLHLSSLSVFMPCFNEAANIRRVVRKQARFLPKIAKKWEIIIVDDGSTDQTAQVVKDLQKHHPQLVRVQHARNLGYGAAVRSGIQNARYEWLFFN